MRELLRGIAYTTSPVAKKLGPEDDLLLEAFVAPFDEEMAMTPTPAAEDIEIS